MRLDVTGADRRVGPDRHPNPQPARVRGCPDGDAGSTGCAHTPVTAGANPAFASPEGLRTLLSSLAAAGSNAWATSPEAAELLTFCASRYERLARKHHLTGHDAAVAAFEALRSPAVLRARNPWAAVTTAVSRTLRAEARADDLLCSRNRARRLMARTDLPAALRIGDPSAPETSADDGPAGWLELALSGAPATTRAELDLAPATIAVVHQVRTALGSTRAVLKAVAWPDDVARPGLDHITTALVDAGNVGAARQRLRKDRQILAMLDIDQHTWTRLVAVVLGTENRTGLLHRLLAGDTPRQVVKDVARALTPPRHIYPQEASHVA